MNKDFWYTVVVVALFIAMILMAGCSHNPAVFTFGKQVKIGTTEYGELSYLNGIAIVDCSRENSEWELEVDDETGIVIDKESNSIKGIKRIKRKIGMQISGYLVDMAKVDAKAAEAYVKQGEKKDNGAD